MRVGVVVGSCSCRAEVSSFISTTRTTHYNFKKLIYSGFDLWVKSRFKFAALRRIGEDLGGDTATLSRIGDKFMRNIIGVDCLDA